MAGIVKANINLDAIPKEKIYKVKKGRYLPISITINDEPDQFGNQGPVCVDQSKEEREAKAEKTYLGNVKVVWTNGDFPEPNFGDQPKQPTAKVEAEEDLPF